MRLIAIDNHSGYIFGDSADINGTIWAGEDVTDFLAAMEASFGEYGGTYEAVPRRDLASNESGYHVYRADVCGGEAVRVIDNGQDRDLIAAVIRDCEYVGTFRCVEAEDHQ